MMKPRSTCKAGVILFALFASITVFAQTTPKPPEPSPLTQISWLTGGTWVAEVKDEKGIATRIENRIRWSENGQLIKFITTFITHNKPEVHYEGIYAWDPAKKQISFWYTDSDGNLTQGSAAMTAKHSRKISTSLTRMARATNYVL